MTEYNSPRAANNSPLAWLVLLCRLGVGLIFLYASRDKLIHPDAFAEVVYNYRLVPLLFLHPFALFLPALEATIGAALVIGVLRRGAALLASLLTVIFIGAITIALFRGLDISCGCFHTDGGNGVGISLLLRDLLLLAACLVALLSPHLGWGLADLRRRS